MLWHGAFIDAAKHWSARGAGFEGPLGDKILRLPSGAPFAILNHAQAEWPKQAPKELGYQFHGYRLGEKRQPTFLYSWNGLSIEDAPRPMGEQDLYVLQRTIRIAASEPTTGAWLRALVADKIDELDGSKFKVDDAWVLSISTQGRPARIEISGKSELRVPLVFDGNKSQIELTYDW